MKKISLAIVSLCFLFSSFSKEEAPIKIPENPTSIQENFHLYLLIGGGNLTEPNTIQKNDKKTIPGIFVLSEENKWIPVLKYLEEASSKKQGLGFCYQFAKNTNSVNQKTEKNKETYEIEKTVHIGLIPCAVPDSEIKRWIKGGDLYAKMFERARFAIKRGTLKGVIWQNGDIEGLSKNTTAEFGKNITELVEDLRQEFGPRPTDFLPALIGKLGYVETPDGKMSYIYDDINSVLDEAVPLIQRSALVETKGLKVLEDKKTFDSPSQDELGRRFAESLSFLQGHTKR